jgi:predicted RNase H-like nuclease (RuvC/YqgF family)
MSLRERTHYDGCEFVHIECAEIVIRELRDTVARHDSVKTKLEIRIQELTSDLEMVRREASALAASQCEDPIADEHGHVWCGRVKKLERQLEQQAWTISPAMAQAKIDELNQALAAVENETGLHEERRQFNQRIAELGSKLTMTRAQVKMLKDQAVGLARLVQRAIAYQKLVSRLSSNECMGDSQWQAAQDVIDQYTTKEPTGGEE